MNKSIKTICLVILFFGMCSMTTHKFYVSIYQINYEHKKKMIQITSRLFIDDVNDALEKKFRKKTFIGEENESIEDISLLKKYFADKFLIKVNGVSKPVNYLSKELENNILICYFNIKDVSKITKLEVINDCLMELNLEQQNIIQYNFNGEKHSLLLTNENIKGMLK